VDLEIFSCDESTFNDMSDSEEEDDDIPLKFISLARQLFNYEFSKVLTRIWTCLFPFHL
jgi:hypothetical protein